ncbi:MAG: cobalamin-dependent protein [Myxococcota bacterium]|nr:cobalamin-dependent protein [Myxococcota bacterium]MDW8360852.1 B12-binding domain-containing radical SAM protein [Myxococcales bacterium]
MSSPLRAAREPRVAFVALRMQSEDPGESCEAFTYAARKLDASVRGDPRLGDVETAVFDVPSRSPQAFLEALEGFRPTLVAMSAYIWSIDLLLEVARELRARDPSVRIVLGGPAARPSVLALAPYRDRARALDAVATGEGEELVRRLASEHLREDWLGRVPGLLVPHALGWRSTGSLERIVLDDYPSPYQLGVGPARATGFLETFRGCPLSCAFCQWGVERADRVHGADYLERHLRGLQQADAPLVFVLDAAFNLSPRAFRALVEAERRTDALRGRCVMGHLYPSHVREEHLAFFEHIGHVQAAIGIQSLQPEVLERMGRPFDVARFERMLTELRGRIAIETELILGLPGDGPDSFVRTFERTLELSDATRVYRALALPDALLERAEAFGIDVDPYTFRIRSTEGWTPSDLERTWEQIVRRTEGMPGRYVADSSLGVRNPASGRGSAARPLPLPRPLAARIAALLPAGSGWTLASARRLSDGVWLTVRAAESEAPIDVEMRLAREGQRSFVVRDGVGFSYRGSLPTERLAHVGRIVEALAPQAESIVREALADPAWRADGVAA